MAKILLICAISPSPLKSTCLDRSSAMMQPRLHMSIAVEYSLAPAQYETDIKAHILASNEAWTGSQPLTTYSLLRLLRTCRETMSTLRPSAVNAKSQSALARSIPKHQDEHRYRLLAKQSAGRAVQTCDQTNTASSSSGARYMATLGV